MNAFSRTLFRIARWIAGPERAEWVDAMAAEGASTDSDWAWAFGCCWASITDRVRRERGFLAIIGGLPIAVLVLEQLLFFPLVWGSQAFGLPMQTFVWTFLCVGFPFGILLARRMARGRAMLAALLCGVVLAWLGIVFFWISFGKGPEIWFQGKAHVYDMTPILGWSINTLLWIAGAWLGSIWRRRASRSATG